MCLKIDVRRFHGSKIYMLESMIDGVIFADFFNIFVTKNFEE